MSNVKTKKVIKKEEKEKEFKEIIVVTQEDVRVAVENNPDMKWFILQTYSGKDAAAKRSIEDRLNMADANSSVGLIVMAEKKFSELRNGVLKTVKKKLYPSYLYLYAKTSDTDNTRMDEIVYQSIKTASNLHGFINQETASLPKAIPNPLEIKKMISQLQDGDVIQNSHDFEIGQKILITKGVFENNTGSIVRINYNKNEVIIDMRMIGSSVEVEMPIDHIIKFKE